ncbi:FAD-dependent oxidoreductase [Fuchsiella alkaliacetigena]|uniref:FAD-dependent oxidoreductase n=1 Tax=Fuchsiella alkaliacetigena TaxID=957042 RepID=UPI00200B5F6E|nr:flavocytochrome c [Fuchsiella alkaliacetigena]MCK8826090.1 flavocytochrome c [Fuchsiella alkaliacetigena]
MNFKRVLLVSFLILTMLAFVACESTNKDAAALPEWDETYDVVVVGGGFAGLAATYNAAEHGADTLLIDKMPMLGGNSQINGGVYAAYTSKLNLSEKLGYEPDTPEKHIEDTMEGGDNLSDPALVKNFVYGSPYFIDLMLENGLEVRDSLARPGGHYSHRTLTTKNQTGYDIVEVQKKLVDQSGAEVMLETEMDRIYREEGKEGKVVGIRVQTNEGTKNIKAENGVILATGGFSGNEEMRQMHVPWIDEDMFDTNHAGATGEGIQLAQEIGANTTDMSHIQLYPFANPENGVLDSPAILPFNGPGAGIVYVDTAGNRYVNEGGRRDECTFAALESDGFPTFTIFNKEMYREFATDQDIEEGIEKGRIFKADTLEELADLISAETYDGHSVDMPGENLAATIEAHNSYVEQGEDPEFGKVIDSSMMTMPEGPYYAVPQWPSVHHTMGGLTITPRTEVRDVWGDAIPGLYAAGEATGGVHGTNRLGSNAIPDAAVHGLIAGQMAAEGTLPDFVPSANR